MEFWMAFSAIAVLIVTIPLISAWWERKNTENWQRAAEELGLTYFGLDNDFLQRFGRFATLQRGRRRRIKNAIGGEGDELEIIVADFRYTSGGGCRGKQGKHHAETLCILRSSSLALPQCSLRPQIWLLDSVRELFGGQDIDFVDDPSFSQAYVLQGRCPEAVREVFGPDVRAWFVERQATHLHFEAQGDTLIFHTGRRISPNQARNLMAEALELKSLLAEQRATLSVGA